VNDRRSALLLALVYLVLGVVLATSAAGPVRDFAHVDYFDYHFAAEATWAGVSPYDADWAEARAGAAGAPWIPGSDYLYAPWFSALLVPLSSLPAAWAANVWFAGSAFATLLALTLLATGLPRSWAWMLAGGLLPPVLFTLFVGQVNAWLLLGLVVAWCLRDRAPGWAGAALGLCAAIKLAPVVLIGWAAWRGRLRTALVALGVVGALGLLGELVSPGSTLTWWTEVLPSTRAQLPHHPHPANQSVYGLALRVFTQNDWTTPVLHRPSLIAPLVAGALGVLALAIAIPARRPGPAAPNAEHAEWAAITAWMLIASPLSWESTWMLALLPLGLLARLGARWSLLPVAALIVAQRAMDGFANAPEAWPVLQQVPPLSSLSLLGGVVLIGLALHARWRTAEAPGG
jgi:hypothetical protein